MNAIADKIKQQTRQKRIPLSQEGIGREYEGLLAEPMYPPQSLMSASEKVDWTVLRATKTLLLFEHFSIDPNSEDAWQRLAIALAANHVPGFKPPPTKPGHPKDYAMDLELWMLVELLKRRDSMTVRSAVERIASARIFEQNSEALRNRYRQALKHKYLKSIWKLLEWHADTLGPQRFIEALDYAIGHHLR